MLAVQRFDVGGIALDGAERKVVFPDGFVQNFFQHRAFVDKFFQHRFRFAREYVGRADYADRAAVVAEGNQPNPHVAVLRMGGNQDFAAVEFRVGDVVVDVGEVRLARRQVRRRFQVKQTRQHTAVAAGVQYEFRGQLIALACVGFHAQTGKVAAVVERGYAVSETNLHALFGGFVNQDFIENPAAHLVNRAGAV